MRIACVLLASEPSIVGFFQIALTGSDAMSDIVGLLLEAAPVAHSPGLLLFLGLR